MRSPGKPVVIVVRRNPEGIVGVVAPEDVAVRIGHKVLLIEGSEEGRPGKKDG